MADRPVAQVTFSHPNPRNPGEFSGETVESYLDGEAERPTVPRDLLERLGVPIEGDQATVTVAIGGGPAITERSTVSAAGTTPVVRGQRVDLGRLPIPDKDADNNS